MNNKYTFCLLAFCLMCVCCSCTKIDYDKQNLIQNSLAIENQITEGDYCYQVQNDTVKIIRFLGDEEEVIIPGTLNNMQVKVIGENAFYQRKEMKKLVLPESITAIEDNAFYRCSSLENVFLPKNIQKIGENPFFRCSALEHISVDSESRDFKDIDGVIFSADQTVLLVYPEGMRNDNYTIPDTVKIIMNSAFGYFPSYLQSLVIRGNVEKMPDGDLFAYPNDRLTLLVESDSEAKRFAEKHGIMFKEI